MKGFTISNLLVLLTIFCRAQDCAQMYVFNITNKGSYSTSCGVQDQSDWIVQRNSCNFYTPLTGVGGKPGEDDKMVDINIRINNSGNLDEKDFAWIFYYINGKTEVTKTFRGDQVDEFFKLRDSIAVPAGGNFKLRIAFVCDGPDEFWKLSNGDLTTCIRGAGDVPFVQEEEAPELGKISVLREREIVKLSWNAPSGPEGNYFIVERSKNGSQYEFAGYVKDNRAAGSMSKYSFIDTGSFKPETWYRISQVDVLGKNNSFGKPVSVKF